MNQEAISPKNFLDAPSPESLRQARNPDFWRSLAPELHISPTPFLPSPPLVSIPGEQLEHTLDQLRTEGYGQVPPILPKTITGPLAAAIGKVVDAGFPGPFAVVYDEVWQLLASLAPLIGAILGPSYNIIPDYWIYHIDGVRERSGWMAHRDDETGQWSLGEDGLPLLLTTWIPLTDATLDTSAMYVLPTNRDPNYPNNLGEWTIPLEALRGIRALPAEAGSVLCWNQYVLHWGSTRSRHAKRPRISLAIYFRSAKAPSYDSQNINLGDPISFEHRLGLAARMLVKYSRWLAFPESVVDFSRSYCQELFGSLDDFMDKGREALETKVER